MGAQPHKIELEAAQRSDQFFEAVLRASADGIVATDVNHNIIMVNDAFCEILGRPWRDVIETNLLSWLGLFNPGAPGQWTRLEQQVSIEGIYHNVGFHIDKEGNKRFFSVNASLLDQEGEDEGNIIISIWRNVSEQVRAERELCDQTFLLDKRIKELNCLFGISKLIEVPGISLSELYQGIIDLIPLSWPVPDVTCARLIINNQEILSENFTETPIKLTSPVIVHGETIGTLQICYHEIRYEELDDLFQQEERSLIDAIAKRIGRITERFLAEEELKRHQNNLEDLVDKRTAELQRANTQLHQEVAIRIKAEEAGLTQRNLAEAFRDTAEILNSSLDIDEILDHILTNVGRVVPHDAVNIHLLDEIAETSRVYRVYGYEDNLLPGPAVGRPYKLEDMPTYKRIISTQQPLVIPDTYSHPDWVKYPETSWIRSYACAPICVEGKVTGFLNLDSATENFFTSHHAILLKAFADQAATAIQNARLYNLAQQEIEERTQIERNFKSSEEYARNIIVSSLNIIITSDLDRHIVEFNTAAEQAFGYKREEVIGKHVSILYAHPQESMRTHETTISEEMRVIEILNRRKNGDIFPAILSASLLRDASGEIVGTMGIARDITDQKKATIALEAAELRYRTIADFTYDWEYWENPDGSMRYVSPSCERITGYTADQFINNPLLRQEIIFPEDRKIWEHHHHHNRTTETPGLQEIQYRLLRSDGEIIWIEHVCQPVKDEQGNFLGFRASNRDITARKLAEEQIATSLEEKETLLKEIHHRVKNNMQTINSLLQLQSSGIQDARISLAFTEAQSRIRSMGTVHEMLYKSTSLARIDFGEYILNLSKHLFSTYNINPQAVKLQTDVQDVSLDLKKAVPCGLLINELISNSLKHAFPGGKPGEVSVRLSQEGDLATLMVSDNGIGLSPDLDWQNTSSLGLQLVGILSKQLKGEVNLDQNGKTTFMITFPVKS